MGILGPVTSWDCFEMKICCVGYTCQLGRGRAGSPLANCLSIWISVMLWLISTRRKQAVPLDSRHLICGLSACSL